MSDMTLSIFANRGILKSSGRRRPETFIGKKSERVLDDSRPPFYGSFPGALLNTCYNGLGRADRHHSPVTSPHGHGVGPVQCQSTTMPNGSDEGAQIV